MQLQARLRAAQKISAAQGRLAIVALVSRLIGRLRTEDVARCGWDDRLRGDARVRWVRLGSVDPLSCPLLIEWGSHPPVRVGGHTTRSAIPTSVSKNRQGRGPPCRARPYRRTTTREGYIGTHGKYLFGIAVPAALVCDSRRSLATGKSASKRSRQSDTAQEYDRNTRSHLANRFSSIQNLS